MKKTKTVSNPHLIFFHEYIMMKFKDTRATETIPVNDLEGHIASFLINVRQKDGSEYEPSTFRSMHSSFEHHLREDKYGHYIGVHLFDETWRAMKSKATDMKISGKGNLDQTAHP